MADALFLWLHSRLPQELVSLTKSHLDRLAEGRYEELLSSEEARELFGHNEPSGANGNPVESTASWNDFIFNRLGSLLADRSTPEQQVKYFCIGYAALLAFLQLNVTGPPTTSSSAKLLLPPSIAEDKRRIQDVRAKLLASFSVDGIAAYKLTPNVELLSLVDAVMTCPAILKNVPAARLAKLRVTFMQQRLLSEVSSTLQDVIYDDLELLAADILGEQSDATADAQVGFLLERATIHIHHGLDKFARQDLDRAKEIRRFEFAITGLLGKRTKFQQKDISQLVVLAKSAGGEKDSTAKANTSTSQDVNGESAASGDNVKPVKLDLNDDTLLESISFTEKPADLVTVQDEEALPASLKSLDPAQQPQLNPADSCILLALASSITNTSPQHGLTREETLPYATRVLDGGSSNWQVYTQALLVRSRIEGHKSRTIERGLLQLQALVDQVIADTTGTETNGHQADNPETAVTSFLPRADKTESAPVSERLRYVFQLASPTRWDLEAELATRWVQLGGLRSALEIYERLEMWAEAALCWAATEREDKAKLIIRRQLFHAAGKFDADADDDETWTGAERDPPPPDAPRLYCILGDIDQDTAMWEKAWEVSKQRYARAQRSLGRHFINARDFVKAAGAYSKSLRVNQLNHQSWFALGCALLELAQYQKAVEAFSRCVQLDESDAESWSNLAAALLRTEPDELAADAEAAKAPRPKVMDDEDDIDLTQPKTDTQHIRHDALKALRRVASLQHDSYRIWENMLVVAASLTPPDFASCLTAQKRIVDIRAKVDGERCLDKEILELMAQHVISSSDRYDPAQPGFARMFVKFVDESVVPLITGSADLWQLVGRLAIWRNKPTSALEAEEKAWRVVTAQPGWESDSEARWNVVVDATIRLCNAYESLGPKERTEGMGAGELVAKDWNFKARSAIRGILGKGKSTWEDSEGWERLQEEMSSLKG